MIHTVQLPDFTQKQLSEIVCIQIHLLHYAATHQNIDAQTCAEFLDKISEIADRGVAIAEWIWKSKDRYEPLTKFAAGLDEQKKEFARQVQNDINLFESGIGCISPLALPKDKWRDIPDWKTGAWKFLQNFYEDFCNGNGFPAKLFSSNQAFGVQDFLSQFVETNVKLANRKLHMCPACDDSPYLTHRPNRTRRPSSRQQKKTLAQKDHFLPISLYPHLSCHPRNLVPLCPFCNQIKSHRDILNSPSGIECSLQDILIPYKDRGLGEWTFLEVKFNEDIKLSNFGEIKARTGLELQQKAEAFRHVYEIPDRWDDENQVARIADGLVERISTKLQRNPVGFVNRQELLSLLKDLHNELEQVQGRDPLGYAQTSLLSAAIAQEVEPVAVGNEAPISVLLPIVDAIYEQEQRYLDSDLYKRTSTSRQLLNSTLAHSRLEDRSNPQEVADEQPTDSVVAEVEQDIPPSIAAPEMPTTAAQLQLNLELPESIQPELLIPVPEPSTPSATELPPSPAELGLPASLPNQEFLNLLEAIVQRNTEAIFNQCYYLVSYTQEPVDAVQYLINFYEGDLLRAREIPHRRDLVTYTEQTWERLCALAQQQSVRNFYSSLQLLRRLKNQLQNNTPMSRTQVAGALAYCCNCQV